MKNFMRLCWGFVVAVATAAVLLQGASLPRGFWRERDWLLYMAVAVLAGSALIPIVRSLRAERGLAYESRVLECLKAGFVRVLDATELDWRSLGIHAFMVRRRPPQYWEKVQVRVGRWRLKSTPPVTGIRWKRGKGAIGVCWEKGEDVFADLGSDWGEITLSHQEWDDLPKEKQWGLSYDEYLRVRGYGAIVVTPLFSPGNKYIGCVSIDGPAEVFEALSADPVPQILQETALSIWRSTKNLSHG